jgi:hypothetical protein
VAQVVSGDVRRPPEYNNRYADGLWPTPDITWTKQALGGTADSPMGLAGVIRLPSVTCQAQSACPRASSPSP